MSTRYPHFDFARAASENYTWLEILEASGFVETESFERKGVVYTCMTDSSGVIQVAFRGEDDKLFEIQSGLKYSKRDAIADLYFEGRRSDADEFVMVGSPLRPRRLIEVGLNNRAYADDYFAHLSGDLRYEDDLAFAMRVDIRKAQLLVEHEAKRKFAEETQILPPRIPNSLDLQELLDADDEPEDYLIDGLLERVSTATIVASAKTGKTTFIYNLIRSLVDRQPFLGAFQTHGLNGKVGFVNFELSDSQAKRWFRDVPIVNKRGAVRIWNLRGKTNPFSNPYRRQEFIDEVKEQNIEVMILDPFSSAARGHNSLDNDDVKDFLLDLEEFKEEAGVKCLIIAVHAGHNSERARGASTLADHPDAIMTLERSATGIRTFKAHGRDVDVEKGTLLFDPATRLLSYSKGTLVEARVAGLEEKVLAFVMANPGCSAGDISQGVSGTKTLVQRARDSLVRSGAMRLTEKSKGRKEYTAFSLKPGTTPPSAAAGGGSPLFIGGATTTTDDDGPRVFSYMSPLSAYSCSQGTPRRSRVRR